MRSSRLGFGQRAVKQSADGYDLFEDYDLIEASFAQQYGIRLRHERNMPYSEFTTLLAGLDHETPLGRIVGIRTEDDKDQLKAFTPEMRKIRRDWQAKVAKKMAAQNPNWVREQLGGLQAAFKAAYGSKDD